jgi:5-methyltetrahydropteroyltriglutamate--homocysteine methyltransferase
MLRSESRILTTHAGSLPRPKALIELNRRRVEGEAVDDELTDVLRRAVADVVRKQVECGIDVVNDGELGKTVTASVDYGAWLAYAWERLGGWERGESVQLSLRDADQFPTFYPEMWGEFVVAKQSAAELISSTVFTGPVTYRGQEATRRDSQNLRAALEGVEAAEAFVTAVAPYSFERGQNRHYASERDFLFAIADALQEEYHAIVDAGFLLQLDEPAMADKWALAPPELSVEEYRETCRIAVEVTNRALEGIPPDRVRLHVCWGSWHGPHTTDIPLGEIVELLLQFNVGAYSLEASNVRHELDYKVWEDVDIPDNLILIPGVVSHATNLVEPPELVAERIVKYAEIVGRERVIAGTDCGLGGRVHEEIAWAKLRALADGARLASERLWAPQPAPA